MGARNEGHRSCWNHDGVVRPGTHGLCPHLGHSPFRLAWLPRAPHRLTRASPAQTRCPLVQNGRPASDAAGAGHGGFWADHTQRPTRQRRALRPQRCPVLGPQTSSPIPCALALAQVASLPGASFWGCRRAHAARPATGSQLGQAGTGTETEPTPSTPLHTTALLILPLGLESYSGSFSICTQPETQLRQPTLRISLSHPRAP